MQQANDMDNEVKFRLIGAVESMPAFPSSVQKVLELCSSINCPSKELVAVIEKDPVMTVKILRVINSAYYSLPNKITSVGQSVVYLGITTVKNFALALAATGTLPKRNPGNLDIQKYLVHSLSTACIARQLCNLAVTDVEPGDAYVAGLLHDFGKVVMAQYMAEEYRTILSLAEEKDIPLDQAERDVIGVDHAYVGAMLTQRWRFPDDLVQCIADHHNPDAEPTLLLDCLRVANQLSRRQRLGDGRDPFREDEQPASIRFGEDFDTILEALGDVQRFIDEAIMFAKIGST